MHMIDLRAAASVGDLVEGGADRTSRLITRLSEGERKRKRCHEKIYYRTFEHIERRQRPLVRTRNTKL